MSRSRVWAAAGLVTLAAGLVGAAFVAGAHLRSPRQAAADAAPPPASLVTAAVQRRVLTEPVVLRGHVQPGASIKLYPPPGAVGEDSVITSVSIKKGQTLRDGMLIAVRSGQPLFVLTLPFPMYRDLVGGMHGPDVTAVQKELTRLGYRTPASGVLDAATQNALRRFFRRRGQEPVAGSATASADLAQAQSAEASSHAAYEAAVAARSGVDEAKAVWDSAKAALDHAKLVAGPALPRSMVVRVAKADAKISTVHIGVGTVLTKPDEPLLELDQGKPYVIAGLSKDQSAQVEAGQPAQVVDESTGTSVPAQVASVAAVSADAAKGEGAGSAYQARLEFDGRTLSPAADRSVRVDISAAGEAAEVLAVPVTAVYARPDGTTFVTLQRAGATVDVTVTTGRIAGGWVEITDGGLAPGDLVVVSEAASGAAATGTK